MPNTLTRISILSCFLFFSSQSIATLPYSANLCDEYGFSCIRTNYGQSWYSMFPDPTQRDIVMRVNRMNTELYPGRLIAIPNNLATAQIDDFMPFTSQINPSGHKTIVYDPKINAWGAFDRNGQLVKWGPGAGGSDWCADLGRSCHTKTGVFTIYTKGGPGCKSSIYPIPKGGAPMPYCMFFSGGYALHGSYEVPGFNASHGCVRLYVQDAQWLNQSFIDVGSTKVVILSY